jgi:mannose-6-phosphate isomerase
MPVRVIEGCVQHYAWGDREFLPHLLGLPGRGEPWAELWLGTHPNGPATLADDGSPLADLTGPLPYLLKILSAAEPLSLQAHPTPAQAAAGFERGVFGDPFAKPELLVALTPFDALCGFRPADTTIEILDDIGADDLARRMRSDGLPAVFHGLYRGEIDPQDTIGACAGSGRTEAALVRQLNERYPGEPSVVATLLLNLVHLEPGQAIHLTAGNLHAYLRGSGIELMGASDNVVRGGLTVKEVDVDLLLDIVDTTPLDRPVTEQRAGRYDLPEAGVALLALAPGDSHRAVGHELAITGDGTTLYLSPGTPIFAADTTYVVTPI